MNERKKVYLRIIILMLFTMLFFCAKENVKAEEAEQTIIDEKDAAKLVSKDWKEEYFSTMKVEVGSDTIEKDGTEVKLSKELGVSKSKASQIVKSKKNITSYFEQQEDSIYETEVTDTGQVEVKAPFQMKRLVIQGVLLTQDYGASKRYYLPEYKETILSFETEEDTKNAFEQITEKYGKGVCTVDQMIYADDVLSSVSEESTYSSISWGAKTMGMESLKNESEEYGIDSDVTVAVIDTGVNTKNSLFAGRTFSNLSYNFFDASSDISDSSSTNGHGTHVCGIIADSTPDNVDILMLKVFGENDGGSILSILSALQYAVSSGADVINLSLGWDKESTKEDVYLYSFLDKVIDKASKEGIPICVAAGNESTNVNYCYPASNEEVLAVSAMKGSGDSYSFASGYSNYGKRIDFAAPGSSIVSASMYTNTGTTTKSGTSMASPHIAAAVSYLKMMDPQFSVDEITEKLKYYSVDLGATGKDDYYGWGYPMISNLFKDNYGSASDPDGCVHSYIQNIKTATCLADGSITYQCSKCKDTKIKIIPASGHVWDEGDVDDGTGILTYHCSLCGIEKKAMASGSCGSGLTYSYEFDTGVMTISGTGKMTEYGDGNFPWSSYASEIYGLVLKEGVQNVAEAAFANTENLGSISWPSTCVQVGKKAFYGAAALSNISIPVNLTEIGDGAFCACPSLTSFTVDGGNKNYMTDGTALYSKDGTSLYAICAGFSDNGDGIAYVVSKDVSNIGAYAFSGCRFIEELTIASDRISVGDEAFGDCRSLSNVFMECDLTGMGNNVFLNDNVNLTVNVDCEGWESYIGKNLGGTIQWTYEKSEEGTTKAEERTTKSEEETGTTAEKNTTTEKTQPVTQPVITSPKIDKPKNVKVLRKKKRQLIVRWKKNLQVTRTEIQYATNKKFKKSKTIKIKTNHPAKYIIKKLKSKKIYYIRMRNVKVTKGIYTYSGWTKIKKYRVK